MSLAALAQLRHRIRGQRLCDGLSRWLSTFAGLDNKIDPWIQIFHDGHVVASELVYRKQLDADPPRYLSSGEIFHV